MQAGNHHPLYYCTRSSLSCLLVFMGIPIRRIFDLLVSFPFHCIHMQYNFWGVRPKSLSTVVLRVDTGCPALCPYIWDLYLSLSVSIRSHFWHISLIRIVKKSMYLRNGLDRIIGNWFLQEVSFQNYCCCSVSTSVSKKNQEKYGD